MERACSDGRAGPPNTAPEDDRARARKQKKKGSPVVLDDEETAGLTWLCDGSLSALSKKHRKVGRGAFDTCNANAWPGALEYLARSKVDLLAVQEAKTIAIEVPDAEQAIRNAGWKMAISSCTIATAHGTSVGGREWHDVSCWHG